MQRALDFDRSPPLRVSFRFILNVPLFLMLAALGLAWLALSGQPYLRWNPLVLATAHLFTLGVLASAMLGALMQILPVATRLPLLHVRITSFFVHICLTAGTLALAAGFISAVGLFHTLAVVLLGAAFLVFLSSVAAGMARHWSQRAPGAGEVLSAVRLALLALLVTVVLGAFMAGLRGNLWGVGATQVGAWLHDLPDLHVAWGLAGWVGLLVVGVSYQVIPIFQATEIYPQRLTDTLAPAVFVLLGVITTAGGWQTSHGEAAALLRLGAFSLLAIAFLMYAGVTSRLLWTRKRPSAEPTTRFWHLSMACLVLAAALGVARAWWPAGTPATLEMALGTLLIPGFAVSAVNGMLYKIVPFLLWHNAQRQAPVALPFMPKVRQFIPERAAHRQFLLHLSAVVLLTLACMAPALLLPAALALAASAGMLGWNIFRGLQRYLQTSRQIVQALADSPPFPTSEKGG
ncbi:MAG TPA: hypothetical protein VKZ52_08715 [Burkholderiaceae bacterium]|nr:hypothetical protein [Burkholderiaceae bacterium]